MRAWGNLFLAGALLGSSASAVGEAPPGDAARIITFIEVQAPEARHAGQELAQYARTVAAGLKAQSVVALEELARPERFIVLESAADRDTLTAAEGRGQTRLDALSAALTAPVDRRGHRVFGAMAPEGADAKPPPRGAIYVIAHLDIGGPVRGAVEEALRSAGEAARRTPGNLRFEVWQQLDRPNHFHLLSSWRNQASFEGFAASRAAREFRAQIAPLLGSPYDERLYRRIRS